VLQQKFHDIASAGFSWVRVDYDWSIIQRTSTPKFDLARQDRIVKAARSNNLKVLGILAYAPTWAARKDCTNKHACAPADPALFSDFAGAVASHSKGEVNNWEIWNEQNSQDFWSPKPSANDYTSLLKGAYSAIKQQDPSATVVSGGMDAYNTSQVRIDSKDFLTQMYKDGAKGSFDALGYHPYTYPSSPMDKNNGWSKMAEDSTNLLGIMKANGDGDKQIWMTEYGAPTNGPVGSGFVDEKKQEGLVHDVTNALLNKPWAGPLFWYTYQDLSLPNDTKQNYYGLEHVNGSGKPALDAWRQLLTAQ
jgi:hypothetical protein